MGWHAQGDGKCFYGLNVENGRIKDEGAFRLKTALREICRTLAPPLRLTPHQSIIFCDLKEADRPRLFEILRRNGVPLSEDISDRAALVDGLPGPADLRPGDHRERADPADDDRPARSGARRSSGLGGEVFTTRMTGCPNGCARPYNSDIGLVGKTKDKYTIFLGGRRQGDRLNFIYQDLVPTDEVVPALVPVLRYFKDVARSRAKRSATSATARARTTCWRPAASCGRRSVAPESAYGTSISIVCGPVFTS